MTVGEALRQGAATLRAAGIDGAGRDTRKLMAAAYGLEPGRVVLLESDPLTDEAEFFFFHGIAQRAARQPVSRILGKRAFFGRDFVITDAVLDPRPETETLVEQAVAAPFSSVLDLGTGSGVILLTLLAAWPDATGIGTDISPAALAVAEMNAKALNLNSRLALVRSDWFDAVGGRFDLIVSNPPYIAEDEMAGLAPEVRDWDPEVALTPGGDGLDAYRAIIGGAPEHLEPGGRLVVEIGASQGKAVSALLEQAEFREIAIHPDLDGRDRVISAKAP